VGGIEEVDFDVDEGRLVRLNEIHTAIRLDEADRTPIK
jgi:hypothetical protein